MGWKDSFRVRALIWIVGYFILAMISLKIDDPTDRISVVWFASGLATSSLIYEEVNKWLMLSVLFLVSRLFLDAIFQHDLLVSIVISMISISCDIAIAYCVKKFKKQPIQIGVFVYWLIPLIVVSLLSGFLVTFFLSHKYEVVFFKSIMTWSLSNIIGSIIVTTILTGIISKDFKTLSFTKVTLSSILTIIIAIFIFSSQPVNEINVGVEYTIACVPILMLSIIYVTLGSRCASICFTLVCVISIYFSLNERGPFLIKGLYHGESISVIQYYLTSIAVLLIFVKLQVINSKRVVFNIEEEFCSFYIDVKNRVLIWDEAGKEHLVSDVKKIIPNLDGLLSSFDEGLKQRLNIIFENKERQLKGCYPTYHAKINNLALSIDGNELYEYMTSHGVILSGKLYISNSTNKV